MKKRWTMLLALLLSLFMMMTSIPGIADEMVSDEWEEFPQRLRKKQPMLRKPLTVILSFPVRTAM